MNLTAGVPASFSVTAVDGGGQVVPSFTGTISFSANDPNATLPASYTFTAADAGVHQFQLIATAAGTFWVQATSTASAGVYGTANASVVAGAASRFSFTSYPSSANVGLSASATVTAYDEWWNEANYSGTAVFTSSDTGATLPVAPAFTNGVATAAITFSKSGSQSVTVTDSISSSMTDTFWTTVAAGPNSTITAPANVTAGLGATASVSSQAGVTYAWTIGGGTITAGAGTSAITFTAGPVGNLTLGCTVKATASGATSTSSRNVSVVAAPVAPVVTAPPSVTAGTTGNSASVSARSGMTYSWSITGGTITSSTSGTTSSGVNSVKYTAGAVGTITLSCREVNVAGTSSAAGTATVAAVTAPTKPSIAAAATVTTGATGLTATVAAHSGMTYTWSIAGGAITSATSGVTSGSTNAVTYTAGAVGTLTLSCTESNGATTSAAGTKSESVVAAPVTPAITTRSTAIAAETGLTASVVTRAGMHYAWTISNGTITSSGGSAGVTSGGTNTITFTAGSAGTLALSAVEINAANTSSSPANAAITVAAAGTPVTPSIATSSPVTAGAAGLTASVTARSGFTYAWTIDNGSITSANGAAGVTSGGINKITFAAGTVGAIHITCAESNGATQSTPAVATVNAIAPPATPSIAAASTAVAYTTGLTASVTANAGMTYRWTVSNGTITSPGGTAGVTSGGANSVTFSAGGTGTLTLTCAEVNQTGAASAPGSASVTLTAPPPATPTINAASTVTAASTGLTASVSARTGMSYQWTISGGTLTSATSGVTTGGINAVTFSAGTAGTLTLTCLETNGTDSSTPGTATIDVVAAPAQPTINAPAMATAGQTGLVASVGANPGMTYAWTVSGGSITGAGGAAGTTAGGLNSITFTAGSSPAVSLSCTEINSAGASGAPGSATVSVKLLNGPSGTVFVVAHQDDETLFFEPDVNLALTSGKPATLVWVMAGGSGDGAGVWQARENQSRNAVADSIGVASDWTCTGRTFGTAQTVQVCTLAGVSNVRTVHLRLPDGSLANLWAQDSDAPFYVTPSASLETADNINTYTRGDLIDALNGIYAAYAPQVVGTMDGTFAYGDDHTDHAASALFALAAVRTYRRPLGVHVYRGYSVDGANYYPTPVAEATNLGSSDIALKTRILTNDYGLDCSPSGFGLWCPRRYAIGRVMTGTGALRSSNACLDTAGSGATPGATVSMTTCSGTATQNWTVSSDGTIRTQAGLCLAPGSGGGVVATSCDGTAAQAWALFSNGQLRGDQDACLTTGGSAVSLAVCDADRSANFYKPLATQSWVATFGPPMASAMFTDAEVPSALAYSGTLALADVTGDGRADACARFVDGVHCAVNAGNGNFAAHTLWSADFSDSAGWQADAYGSTVQFADVNGDGRADVCGRSATGIVCALALAGGGFGPAALWTTDFSDAQGYAASASLYRSLRIVDVNGDGYADVCARSSSSGVVCALNTLGGGFAASRSWIADYTDASGWSADNTGSTLMFADIDGDGLTDVCGRSATGIRCAFGTGAAFADARAWSFRTDFTDSAGWGAMRAQWGSLRLADIDGDGRADLCGRSPSGVVCAISNGGSFDGAELVTPGAFTDATGFSVDAYGGSLSFGDLNRDGHADACARSSTGLVCAAAPATAP